MPEEILGLGSPIHRSSREEKGRREIVRFRTDNASESQMAQEIINCLYRYNAIFRSMPSSKPSHRLSRRAASLSPHIVGIGIGLLSWLVFLIVNKPLGMSKEIS